MTPAVPRRICGQGVVPAADAADGIDLTEATVQGPKFAQILGLEGSALREAFGGAAEQLHLPNDIFSLLLVVPQPGKLILGVRC